MGDCPVLFNIFTSTGGLEGTWVETTGWNAEMSEGVACCFAFGVGCSSGRVTSISLQKNGLEGHLPDVFDKLDMLKELDLSDNSLFGSIPPSLNDLLDDAQVDLSNNLFSGAVPDMGVLPGGPGSCNFTGNTELSCTMAPNTGCNFSKVLPACTQINPGAIGSVGQNLAGGVPSTLDSMIDDDGAVVDVAKPVSFSSIGEPVSAEADDNDSLVAAHKAMANKGVNFASADYGASSSYSEDFGKEADAGLFVNGQEMAPVSEASSTDSSKPKIPLAGIIGGAVALLVVGSVTPAAVIALRRKRAAELEAGKNGYVKPDDASSPDNGKKWFGSVTVGKKRVSPSGNVDIPSSFERGSSREIASQLATSNVRRFNVDGAYPGMPGFREDEEDRPAFTPSQSRRGSAVSVTSDMSDDSANAPSRRGSSRHFQLQDPIMERASEDLARDLEEAGAAKSSESPYGAAAAKPSTVGGFFSRLMGSSARSPVATEDDSPTTALEGVTASTGQMDAKSLYSHQTQHEVREGLVQQVKSSGAGGAGGSYTGFTAPGSSAAKRAASRAKKGRNVPNVTPTRHGSL
ncbi:hypothetical protein HDU67_008923 [Dinochytrium kinnereticum]|nr:hypothetical protein HDU67_008923 [Dinochytrium kinnereticum]